MRTARSALFNCAVVAGLAWPAASMAAVDAKDVVETYSDIAHAMYEDSLTAAKALDAAIAALLAKPDDGTLAAARQAWIAARVPYQQTEGYRFGNAIVDDWEGRVNAWPLDEGLIDYVDAGSYGTESDDNPLFTANVVASKTIRIGREEIDVSAITKELLADELQEAQGVEANVATGYHAIEFLLWGQDLNGTGPGAGNRPATDFSLENCTNGNCDRRRDYLTVWTYGDELIPVRRVRIDDAIRARLVNTLPEHTTIHWHGVRVPNAMDGVQYVTQPPVEPGESFLYEFTPPDTGTFFFHPHCNEPGQVGRGLAGVLIVEGDERTPSNADIVMAIKDWRLAEDGSWLDFETNEGASRAGTFGTRRAVNGRPAVDAAVPAHGDIRLRLLNLDSTRQIQAGVEGADAAVIAIDGNAVDPFPLDTWRFGPAMRVDVLVRAGPPGSVFTVNDYFAATPYTLGRFAAEPSALHGRPFDPDVLFRPSVPRADLSSSERLTFEFSAAAGSPAAIAEALPDDHPLKDVMLDSLCVGSETFWAINKQTWPGGDHRRLPAPLAQLRAGRSYVFELMNATPHPHPIHLHGHTFEVLSASRQELPVFLADTVLLQPRERVEIAFVAAPGNWMFHCHVLEHLETGMMGWLKVA